MIIDLKFDNKTKIKLFKKYSVTHVVMYIIGINKVILSVIFDLTPLTSI